MSGFEEFTKNQIALITAILTIFASLLVAWITSKIKDQIAKKDRTYERKVFLREKYEEFGILFADVKLKINLLTLVTPKEYDAATAEIYSGLHKLYVFVHIYFPAIEKDYIAFDAAAQTYLEHLVEIVDFEVEGPIGDQETLDLDSEQEHYKMYEKTQDRLFESYIKKANHYTHLSDPEIFSD